MSDIHAEVEGTTGPVFVLDDGLQVYECFSCGAVVYARFTHVEWHREQDER